MDERVQPAVHPDRLGNDRGDVSGISQIGPEAENCLAVPGCERGRDVLDGSGPVGEHDREAGR